ncbi:MAG: GntR family transcriptional regulator [Lachnospiraceae bacterium]|jgi:GntR family transcriptional regulator|nr:GntR family transcriptional regulator [Lachnospiraceae bacterium]
MNKKSEHTPVYMTIFSALCEQIVNGSLAPGEILPSENELCNKYGTTRETVRKGLKRLEEEGLIFSRPRRGYFVNSPQHNEFTVKLPDYICESTSRFKDIRIMKPSPEIQEALQIPSSQKVIAVFRGNYVQNEQIGIEIKYLPYTKGLPSIESEIDFAVFPDAASAKTASFRYYTQLDIRAVTGPEEIQAMLGCEQGEALLLIVRRQITQEGIHVGYSKQYLRSAYGELHGVSGFVRNKF